MQQQSHTVKSYDEELRLLTDRVAEMAEVTESQLVQAVAALSEEDNRLAKAVIRNDEQVNAIQYMVDELTVRMLAKRQPMALDLRIIVSSQKIAADLERIADYAANIAKNALQLNGIKAKEAIGKIQEMAECALKMLRTIRTAYGRSDVEAAIVAWKSDETINALFTDLIVHLRDSMSLDPDNVKAGTILLFTGRCCERIGDHLKNVAEQICYIGTGKTLEECQ